MIRIPLHPEPFLREQIPEKLAARGILINRYAGDFFAHPAFVTEKAGDLSVVILSVGEIGLAEGGTLGEIAGILGKNRLKPCPPNTGLFLRLAWTDQPESADPVLTGTHSAPDGAVTVFSEQLEPDDAFPKGLYLRKAAGKLWLRGYVCDSGYRFPAKAQLAFRA